ncbi:MAG: aspartyl/asparaginyl beta-hydroxylase domain-containing protein [Verrucomicrobia bacterium]|nr:aspartyl/asparaginyl beta-hydroxylase domain-containing protein [Verrucomicrobiota bacterium]
MPTAPPNAAKLSLVFDPAGLQADLAKLGSNEWVAHFNTGFFSGDWSGAALRSVGGDGTKMYADTSHGDFANTALLQECRHLKAVIESFQCPLRSVRLLRLTAGSVIREHRDYDLGYDAGEVRLHVPVITNPQVEFYLNNRRFRMAEGECWYLDLNLPHRVQNRGATDRVHLVIDCQLNDWLRDLISQGEASLGEESSYEAFHRQVLEEPALQEELIGLTDQPAFIQRIMELAQQRGFSFMEDDVTAALQSARRNWMERNIV